MPDYKSELKTKLIKLYSLESIFPPNYFNYSGDSIKSPQCCNS